MTVTITIALAAGTTAETKGAVERRELSGTSEKIALAEADAELRRRFRRGHILDSLEDQCDSPRDD